MEMISIYIMGKKYEVPKGLTIMKAMEYAGYRFIRGCGCRDGKCGACGTVYRTPDSYKLKVALACQIVIEENMDLTQIPFYPANKAIYDINKLTPSVETIIKLYPEINRCLSCNTCKKICPQELEVMQFMQAALRGDIEKVAKLSFECIMCGLCASRCPAETVQYYISILCRRLYAKYLVPKAPDLEKRGKEIEEGMFDQELQKLTGADRKTLEEMYAKREIEAVGLEEMGGG